VNDERAVVILISLLVLVSVTIVAYFIYALKNKHDRAKYSKEKTNEQLVRVDKKVREVYVTPEGGIVIFYLDGTKSEPIIPYNTFPDHGDDSSGIRIDSRNDFVIKVLANQLYEVRKELNDLKTNMRQCGYDWDNIMDALKEKQT